MFYLRRITLSSFDSSTVDPPDSATGWKIYGWCETNDMKSLAIRSRLLNYSAPDAKAVLDGVVKLLHKAPIGKPLNTMYDKKQCHEAHSVLVNGKEYRIWRLWPGGVVRIFFWYGSNHQIIIAWPLVKREDKLSNSEKTELGDLVKRYVEAVAKNEIQYLV